MDEASFLSGYDPRDYLAVAVTVDVVALTIRDGVLKVLLVDTDSQGNVGVSLDVKAERSLYHVLVMGLKAKDAALHFRAEENGMTASGATSRRTG